MKSAGHSINASARARNGQVGRAGGLERASISSRLVSSRLIPSHPIPSHLIPSRLVWSRLISSIGFQIHSSAAHSLGGRKASGAVCSCIYLSANWRPTRLVYGGEPRGRMAELRRRRRRRRATAAAAAAATTRAFVRPSTCAHLFDFGRKYVADSGGAPTNRMGYFLAATAAATTTTRRARQHAKFFDLFHFKIRSTLG